MYATLLGMSDTIRYLANLLTSSEAKEKMKDNKESLDLRCATVISELDDISNDPNVPSHGRAAIYTIISKLEALSKS